MANKIQEAKTYIKNRQLKILILKAVGWFSHQIGRVSHRLDRLLYKIFSHFPLREDIIVFRSTSDFSDNARVFYDYLINQGFNMNHKIIWILLDTNPRNYAAIHNVKFVKLRSWYPVIRTDYFCAVAKCIIFTHGFGEIHSRQGQTLIHTTHSASQLKAPKVAGGGKPTPNQDYSLACGPDGLEKKKKSIGLSAERMPILGMPRLDLLFQENNCKPELLKGYNGQKIMLSMETFKQFRYLMDSTNDTDIYAINVIHSQEDLISLDLYLKEQNIILIVKIHPLQDLSFLSFVKLDNIRFLTNQDLDEKGIQLYELVKNADALLTDYSSIFYDYLLLDRPIGFLVEDMDQYDRGFIDEDPFKDMVGEKIYTLDDLKTFIKDVNNGIDHFSDARKELRDRVFTYQDGNNCKRLLEWMLEKKIIS